MPADIIEIRPPILGAPYRLHGRTPEGWDCWGCVAWLRRELFGKQTPDWGEVYGPADAANPVRVAELIAERLHAWSPVAPQAGAVALLTWFGRPGHVGLMINDRDFVHVMHASRTAVCGLNDARWSRRVVGCFDA